MPHPTDSSDLSVFPSLFAFPSLFERVIVITGPTASGKTELAIRVAEAMANTHGLPSAEIVSLDSIAIYRGMDVGSAKPSASERQRVTHHLIDVVDPDHEFSAAEYLTRAHDCVEEIRDRGNVPLFVGGTPMYLKAILKGFHPGPPADEAFRAAAMEDTQRYGIDALRARLEQVDPLSAMRIDRSDARRMIRALEFAKATGVPMSHHQTQFELDQPAEDGLVFALRMPRGILHDRIERRVGAMMEGGLVDEVKRLASEYESLSKTARIGVGYRELFDAIENEGDDLDTKAAAEQILFHTRRLARRQETWFRSFSEIRGLATHDESDPPNEKTIDSLVAEVMSEIEQPSSRSIFPPRPGADA